MDYINNEFLTANPIDYSFIESKIDSDRKEDGEIKIKINSDKYDPVLVEKMLTEVKDGNVQDTVIYRLCIAEVAFNPHACFVLGELYRGKGNIVEAHAYYLMGMKMGYSKCFKSMASLYVDPLVAYSQSYTMQSRKRSALICLKRYLELEFDLQAAILLARIIMDTSISDIPDWNGKKLFACALGIMEKELNHEPDFNRYLAEIKQPDKLKQRVLESTPCYEIPNIHHIFRLLACIYSKVGIHKAYLFKSLQYLSSGMHENQLIDMCDFINHTPELHTFENFSFWFEFACDQIYEAADYQMALFCYNCKQYHKAKWYGDLALLSTEEKMVDLFHIMYKDPEYFRIMSRC
ncbi:MAG: hypothetical protein Hyperionvirus24_19 [Hyperionvirus sp.]|uniref:Tetratricopeptide repeat protein n=1 Tax=Hyperionvirus sp. TaxID=2487770 RepID=A0A3G5AB30_9VIRU|nr:MAG: hypothetical protein Hyperionvirus24_19 [Hyperionvirus sp.]